MVNLIVLGLDGANWELIDPWIKQGQLPNIKELRNNGISTDMRSCLPPVTCPNWRCYSTGKNPGKLGVYWWEIVDTDNQDISIPDSRSFKSSNYWDYLNDEGISAGIMNLPMTYPPFNIDDFMIAGGPGSQSENYAIPESLEKDLDESSYQLHPSLNLTTNDDDRAANSVVNLIDNRLDRFEQLIEQHPVDVAHCTVFYLNNLQHYFWRDNPVKEAWKTIDSRIGSLRSSFPNANFILMSDHGCNEINTVFNVNTWLESEGYLTTKNNINNKFYRIGINQRKIVKMLQNARLYSLVPEWLKSPFRSVLPSDEEGVSREEKFNQLNWQESHAIGSGQGLIYTLNSSTEVREEIVAKLKKLKNKNGEFIAKNVYKSESVYTGPYTANAPSIVFEQADGVHTNGAIGPQDTFSKASHWRAENDPTGLFLATGPDISRDELIDEISITDIAPTILDLMNTPIPSDMDGESLSLANSDKPLIRDPIIPDFVSEGLGSETRERLQDLGYL